MRSGDMFSARIMDEMGNLMEEEDEEEEDLDPKNLVHSALPREPVLYDTSIHIHQPVVAFIFGFGAAELRP